MPLRRELTLTHALDGAAIVALAGPFEGRIVRVLVRRQGDDSFTLLSLGAGARAGDTLVVYNFDPSRDEDLYAVNDLFSASYYPQIGRQAWFDEQQIIAMRLPVDGADILEICCGAGRVTGTLVRDGNRVTAVDKSAACIRTAAEAGIQGVSWRIGDARALEDADASYDVSCCFENSLGVFFGEKHRVLAELIRVTRPGGRILLGLRELAGAASGEIQVYHTSEGTLEVVQCLNRADIDGLCDEFPSIVAREYRPGEDRPWGGQEFFAILTRA
jgi:SAM-dependent methyltransferase